MKRLTLTLAITAVLWAPAAAQDASAAAGTSAADTTRLEQMTPEELFLRASSSALQFAPMLAPSRRILVREHEAHLPYLVTKLDTDDPRERIALEDVLFKIGEPAVLPLIDAMATELDRQDTSRGVRLASSILGRLGDDRAVPALEDAASHPDWKVRSSAAAALGRIGSADSAGAVALMLDDPNEVVRTSACVALTRLAKESGGTLPDSTMDDLVSRLNDRSYAVRFSAADALAACGERAFDRLRKLALRGEGRPRILAIIALGKIGSRDAMPVAMDLTDSPSWVVRGYAARVLGGKNAGGRERRALDRLVGDSSPFVAFCAERSLENAQR